MHQPDPHKQAEKGFSRLQLCVYFRYNSLHIHAVPFNAGDRNEHIDWYWNSVLWRRHGAQRLHLAEGEDDGVQLYEAAATSDDANATAQHAAPQQFNASGSAAAHLATNPAQPEPVDELTNQYNS